MEPLRGGRLAKIEFHLLEKLKQIRPNDSAAAWAFRYAGSYPDVLTVLSGMTYMENLQENIKTYSPLQPVDNKEKVLLNDIVNGISKFPYIGCTGCKYCMTTLVQLSAYLGTLDGGPDSSPLGTGP